MRTENFPSQQSNQTSTCLCENELLSCNTPGDFNYTVQPSNQVYSIQSNYQQNCQKGILFQSTKGITYKSYCPKGSNAQQYKGTPCEYDPVNYGQKSLVYPQMSNSNTNLKCQVGNQGHLMKQWCGLMIWEGKFSETKRCQDFLDMKPILLDGQPLPDGDYTQTAVCPSTYLSNGYVELGETGSVMSFPFTSDSLVWVPEGSPDYEDFQTYMTQYNNGLSVQINENIATLLNGNQPPQGPCSGLFACGTTQVQGQQFQPPTTLQPCQISAQIKTDTDSCFQMQVCNQSIRGFYTWNNYTIQLNLNQEFCQTVDNVVLSGNSTIPYNQSQQNGLFYSLKSNQCNFSFNQSDGYSSIPQNQCYFAATDSVVGTLSGYNVTKETFSNFDFNLFSGLFQILMVVLAIVVGLIMLCCLKDLCGNGTKVVVNQASLEGQSQKKDEQNSQQVFGFANGVLILVFVINISLWASDVVYPEWQSAYAFSISLFLVCSIVYRKTGQKHDLDQLILLSSATSSQLLCYGSTAWLMLIFGCASIFDCSRSIEPAQATISYLTFMQGLIFYCFYLSCSKAIVIFSMLSSVIVSNGLIFYNWKDKITKLSIILSSILIVQSIENSMKTVCFLDISSIFFITLQGLQISVVVSIFIYDSRSKKSLKGVDGLQSKNEEEKVLIDQNDSL